jgi:hypothetical protein
VGLEACGGGWRLAVVDPQHQSRKVKGRGAHAGHQGVDPGRRVRRWRGQRQHLCAVPPDRARKRSLFADPDPAGAGLPDQPPPHHAGLALGRDANLLLHLKPARFVQGVLAPGADRLADRGLDQRRIQRSPARFGRAGQGEQAHARPV